MAKASKSVSQMKKHLTKAEIQFRNENELAVMSGCTIRELPETEADPIAHNEFLRVAGYYVGMKKDDAVYELAVNRYAQMRSREARIKEQIANCLEADEEDALYKKLDTLQDRMFKLEKELLLTPAAALRAIPKTPPKEDKKQESLKDILGL